MTIHELMEKGIPFWPDNDGSFWYWDGGCAKRVKEEQDGED